MIVPFGSTGFSLLICTTSIPARALFSNSPSLKIRRISHVDIRRFVVRFPFMLNESQIRERLADYLAGELSYHDFEDWLIQASWNMHHDSSQDAQDLVSDINLLIYEYLDEHIGEEKLRAALRPFVEHYSTQLLFDGVGRPSSHIKRSSSSPNYSYQVAAIQT